jgi:tetratricopeptide (TPR) repeat protein
MSQTVSAAADAGGGWLRSLRGRYLRLKADACERFGATDRCIKCLEELTKLDPGDIATWRRLQALLAARGDTAGSVRCLEKLAALSPADLGPVKKLAEHYFTSGDYGRALPHFEKLRARNPTDARALTALGEIHLKLNDPAQARDRFQELVVRSKDRNALRWLFKVGQLFLIHQKHEEALRTYRGILEAVPGEPTAQLALSKLTYQGGDLDEAVRIFGSVPEDGALTGLGEKLRHALKLRDAALRELILEGRATEPPSKVPIQTKDGSFFVNVPEDFPRTVKPVYSIDEQRMIRRELIRLYLREGMTDRALFHLTQYRASTPAEGSWVAAQRALALAKRGDLELARAELDRVVFAHFTGRAPSELDLIYEVGHTYLHCGNPARALEAFKRLLMLDIAFKDVEQLVERLRQAGAGAVRAPDSDATKALTGASAHSRHEGSASTRLMGPYELGEPIRSGWMGELFAGRDPSLGRAVVLRRLPPEMMKDPALKERFAVAAREATGLAHPNLVTPLDIVEPAGELWIVTEHVSGVSADALVKERALPTALAAELGAQAAAGLAAAHERKILHRDLKASDFLVDREAKHLRVLDVGIAGVANTLEVAPHDYLARRAHYMPPEFILGERVDEKGDVYSLGILLYLFACGRYPHPEGDLHARLFNYLEKPLPSPREVAPAVSQPLEEIILMCLARDRARRPTAHALSVRLAALRQL